MTEFAEILTDIRKELRCADKYAKEAVKHRAEYPALADVYHRIASDKVAHADMLHKQAHDYAKAHHMDGVWDIEDILIMDDMHEARKTLSLW